MNIKNYFFATGIGSLSFLDKDEVLDFIIESFRENIPFWPQLPKISFLESMHVQFSQGFPGVVIDLSKKNIYIDTQKNTFVDEFEKCFNAINTNKVDYFSIGPDYAIGFHEFLKRITDKDFKFIKAQVTGPISYSMTLLDEKKRPLVFNAELCEIIPKFIGFKARWQIEKLKEVTKSNIIMFIDEPYLVAVGTNQFASLDRNTIISQINSIIRVIHQEGALAGIHCCGNTDWSICLDTDIDILSFDAFGFLDSLFIYKDSLNKFLKRGGVLACGIVPNNEDYNLDGYLERSMEVFKKEPLLLRNGALITPSCGCGTVSLDFAKKVHLLSIDIAQQLQLKQR